MTVLARRSFLAGLGAALAAPAIVHAGNLMPVKVMKPAWREGDIVRFKDADFVVAYVHPRLYTALQREMNVRRCKVLASLEPIRVVRLEPIPS